MEYTDSQKTLISDLVMSIICSGYYWHKTTSVCPDQSDESVLKLLKDIAPWQALKDADISKLGYWKRRKLKGLYFNPEHPFVIKHSKIVVGIYSQIRIKRENNKYSYIDGVKYTDFENNMYKLKQVVDDYISGKAPNIKVVMLQDFSDALGDIIENYNKEKEVTVQ